MKISIREARRRLPELVRRVRKDVRTSVQITSHDQVVAELRTPQREPEPGAAAKKLLELMTTLPKHRGRRTTISSHAKEHLYGSEDRATAKRDIKSRRFPSPSDDD